ncbi:MAG: phosphodiester glycosidase family protein [Clostridiales bacterium]|jgi:exopolysaccharide biosynthesis protein|nr:phosphodiester glycosidase family protein [Clostridiales bacterium]
MRKKLLTLTLSAVLLLRGVAAGAAVIHEESEETPVTKGVTQIITRRFTDNGWYKIHTLKIDLNEEFVSLRALTSQKGVNTRDTLPVLAAENDALGGVNADFFQPSGSNAARASALGVVIKDGALLTTPARGKAMATVAVDYGGVVSMGLWDQYINLIAPDGEVQQIFHINKYYDDGALILFDGGWDENSPGLPIAHTELIVEEDVVTEIRQGQEGVKIPENGYVIASTSASDTFLTDHFQVGDAVTVESWMSPDPAEFETAIGGGTLLLRDGANAPVTHNISGLHPRTAMGVDQTGKIVYLVAVDGRQSASVGMSLDEIRNYMRDLGCYNAINFDGGGSTTFVSKTRDEDGLTVKNTPSDGSLRRVANGIGVVSDAPVEAPSVLEIPFGGGPLYARGAYPLNTQAYDQYYHKIEIDAREVTYSVSGIDGYCEAGVFYPQTSGIAAITAKYRDAESTTEVYILPEKQDAETDAMRRPWDAAANGTKIAVLGDTAYGNILGKLYASRVMAKVNAEADAICLVGGVGTGVAQSAAAPLVYGDYYYAAYKQNNIIIQLNVNNGGLRKADSEQWSRLLGQLNDLTVKNVIITLNQPPTERNFSDGLELDLFKRTLEQVAHRGKNVFVVYDDGENSVRIENGVRYFGVRGVKDIKAGNFASLQEYGYLLITSDGDEVTYQIKPML